MMNYPILIAGLRANAVPRLSRAASFPPSGTLPSTTPPYSKPPPLNINRDDSIAVGRQTTPVKERRDAPSIECKFPRDSDLIKYIIREGGLPVAAGGCADIYRGTLQVPGWAPIKVAIKSIKVYSVDDDLHTKTKRLRREMKVWMMLDHPNVLSQLGTASEFGMFPAMVCRWCDNGKLTSFLERQNGHLAMQQVLALNHDVASGLQYLHSKSIVHGDLSGSNVLIDANGSACIADFGMSTVLDAIGSTFATSGSSGKRRGTLRWAAPEVLGLVDGTGTATTGPTTQSDIYSFGSIMLQILSRKVPYHYYSRDVQIFGAIFRGETPKRPDDPSVTEDRWIFIQRCLSPFRDVDRRPSSEEIVVFSSDDLEKCQTRNREGMTSGSVIDKI